MFSSKCCTDCELFARPLKTFAPYCFVCQSKMSTESFNCSVKGRAKRKKEFSARNGCIWKCYPAIETSVFLNQYRLTYTCLVMLFSFLICSFLSSVTEELKICFQLINNYLLSTCSRLCLCSLEVTQAVNKCEISFICFCVFLR